MLNISEIEKGLWNSDPVKDIEIKIPGRYITLRNSDILWEKLEITETLETEDQLSFTGCNASRARFECVLPYDVRGEYIEIRISAPYITPIPLFCGYVDSQERPSEDDASCRITAYDRLYRMRAMNVSTWFEGLTFPITQKAFREALATVCGLQTEETDLIFDDMLIYKTVQTRELGALDLFKSICMLNAVYGRISRTGRFEFVDITKNSGLYPSPTLYPSPDLYPQSSGAAEMDKANYIKADFDRYYVGVIDKVQIRESENDIGGIYGPGTNAYIIQDNWIAYGRTASELENMAHKIYDKVSSIRYKPAEIKAPGLPYLETGDKISIEVGDGVIETYIMQRTLKGIQILEDTYISEGSKERREPVEDVHYQWEQLLGKTNKLTRTVDGLTSEIYDSATGQSRIDQNAQQISAKVSQTGGDASSFSWELLPDGFILKAGNREVFRCNKNGISVSGYATSDQLNARMLYSDFVDTNTALIQTAKIPKLSADKIYVGTITGSDSKHPAENCYFKNVYATNSFHFQNYNCTFQSITIGNTTYHVPGWKETH